MGIINVSKNELLAKLKMVGKISQQGKGNPVIGQFWIKTNGDNTMTVVGTDLSGTISAVVECITIDGIVNLLVDVKMIIGVLRELPEQPITLKISDRNMTIQYYTGYFDIPIFDADVFPSVSMEENAKTLPIKSKNLEGAISKVVDCAGNNELRPTMNSVFIELKNATLTVVSTNGHALALIDMAYFSGEEVSAIVPVHAARLMLNLISGSGDVEVELKISDKRISIEVDGYRLIYSLLEGRYPNYRAVIPDNDKVVEIGIRELSDAIRRVSVLAEEQYSLIRLKIDNEVLTVISENSNNATFSKEELPVRADFGRFEIGLRSSYTLMLLDKMPGQKCRLSFSDAGHAMVIKPAEDEGILMLQMPMVI